MMSHVQSYKKPLLLGGTVLLIALTLYLVFRPVLIWRDTAFSQLESAIQEREHLQQTLARLSQERAALREVDLSSQLWIASQPGAATARVQSRLSELAAQNGLSLRSVTPVGERELPATRAIGIRLEMEATLDRLVSLLLAAEYHQPSLIIETATLRRLTRSEASSRQPTLFLQLQIVAPIRIEDGADT